MITPIREKIKHLIGKNKKGVTQDIVDRLQDLPALDSIKESVNIFSELKQNSSIPMHEYVQCLYAITRINTPNLTELKKTRAKIKLSSKHIADQIDQAVAPYNRLLFTEYSLIAVELIENKATFLKGEEQLALFFGRMNAVALEMLVWRYYDNQQTPTDMWNILNKSFQFAELNDLLNLRITVSELQEITDVSTLFARVLMFNTLESASYNPNELRVAAAIINTNIIGIGFESAYLEGKHHYYTNLYDDKGACNIRAFDSKANYRYWRVKDMVAKIEDYLLAISTSKLPQNTSIRRIDALPVVTRVLKKLNKEWSPKLYKRQRRASTRNKVEKMIYVAHGLTDICKQLSIFNGDGAPAASYLKIASDNQFSALSEASEDIGGLEKWQISDESDTGFAVELGNAPNIWIEPGRLVGCQHPQKSHQYVIAEIKTVKKVSNGGYRAGIEILSCISQSMNLVSSVSANKEVATGFYLEDDSAEQEQDSSISCLYIPQSGATGQFKSSLIMPVAEYQPNKRFKIQSVDKSLLLGGAIDIHQDWVRAFVRIV